MNNNQVQDETPSKEEVLAMRKKIILHRHELPEFRTAGIINNGGKHSIQIGLPYKSPESHRDAYRKFVGNIPIEFIEVSEIRFLTESPGFISRFFAAIFRRFRKTGA